MTFMLHSQHDVVVLQHLRRGVKLQKILPPGGASPVLCGNDGMSISYDLGKCRCIHRIFWLMLPCVKNGKDNVLKESTGNGMGRGQVPPFRRQGGAIACNVLWGSPIDIQILQRENDSAAANICTRTFMKHPNEGCEARLFVIKPRAFSYLKGAPVKIYRQIILYIRVYLPPVSLEENFILSDIFPAPILSPDNHFSIFGIFEDNFVQLLCENTQIPRRSHLLSFNYLYYINE